MTADDLCPKATCDGTLRLIGRHHAAGRHVTFHECPRCGHYEARDHTPATEPSLFDQPEAR